MNSQITASRAVQHCAQMNRTAEAARQAKLARAARPTVKAEPAYRTPKLISRLVTSRKRTAVPVAPRLRTA